MYKEDIDRKDNSAPLPSGGRGWGWRPLGYGGTATVYALSDGEVLKLFRKGYDAADAKREFDVSAAAFRMGMPIPEPYRIEEFDGQIGIISERIKGDTMSHLLSLYPDKVEEYADIMAALFHKLHSTHISLPIEGGSGWDSEQGSLPNVHTATEHAIRRIESIIGSDGVDKLLLILSKIPQGNSLLHCDIHPRNIMFDGERYLLIDAGEAGYGNPLLDYATTHALMTSGLLDFERFMGFPERLAKPFWKRILAQTELKASPRGGLEEALNELSLIRTFTWLATSDGLPKEVIERFRGHFKRLVL